MYLSTHATHFNNRYIDVCNILYEIKYEVDHWMGSISGRPRISRALTPQDCSCALDSFPSLSHSQKYRLGSVSFPRLAVSKCGNKNLLLVDTGYVGSGFDWRDSRGIVVWIPRTSSFQSQTANRSVPINERNVGSKHRHCKLMPVDSFEAEVGETSVHRQIFTC